MSPKGNLYATGLYPHSNSPASASLLTFAASLAVYDLISTYVPRSKVSLKWPNDVLIEGLKTSGILLERGGSGLSGWVAIGIGVNFESHPAVTNHPATDVLSHMPPETLAGPEPLYTGLDSALAILARSFDTWKDMLDRQGFTALRTAWLERAPSIPGPVTVNLANESFTGQAVDLGQNGELQVRLVDGTIRLVHAGDVFFDNHIGD